MDDESAAASAEQTAAWRDDKSNAPGAFWSEAPAALAPVASAAPAAAASSQSTGDSGRVEEVDTGYAKDGAILLAPVPALALFMTRSSGGASSAGKRAVDVAGQDSQRGLAVDVCADADSGGVAPVSPYEAASKRSDTDAGAAGGCGGATRALLCEHAAPPPSPPTASLPAAPKDDSSVSRIALNSADTGAIGVGEI